jgi:hypothetical protein
LKRVKISLPQNLANSYSDSLKGYKTGAFFEGLKPDARFDVFSEKSTFNNVEINPSTYFSVVVVFQH